MSATLSPAAGWEQVEHPPSLFRRYCFTSYRETRAFLERLAGLSLETGLYPDLGFGTTYVNVTVRAESGGPTAGHIEFANRAAALAEANAPAAATV